MSKASLSFSIRIDVSIRSERRFSNSGYALLSYKRDLSILSAEGFVGVLFKFARKFTLSISWVVTDYNASAVLKEAKSGTDNPYTSIAGSEMHRVRNPPGNSTLTMNYGKQAISVGPLGSTDRRTDLLPRGMNEKRREERRGHEQAG